VFFTDTFFLSESQNKGAPKQESVFDALLVPSVNEVGYNNSSSQHAVCGPGSGYGRSSLHKAICDMDFATIQSELASPNVAEMLQRKDEAGFCPLHSACTLCMKNVRNSSIAVEIVRVLLSAGADVAISDAEQNTPLHWASRAGDRAVAELLLLKNGPQGKVKFHKKPILSSCLLASLLTYLYVYSIFCIQMQRMNVAKRLCIGL
jgi:ankyrin repeat protein